MLAGSLCAPRSAKQRRFCIFVFVGSHQIWQPCLLNGCVFTSFSLSRARPPVPLSCSLWRGQTAAQPLGFSQCASTRRAQRVPTQQERPFLPVCVRDLSVRRPGAGLGAIGLTKTSQASSIPLDVRNANEGEVLHQHTATSAAAHKRTFHFRFQACKKPIHTALRPACLLGKSTASRASTDT